MHRKITDLEKRVRAELPPSPVWDDLARIIAVAVKSPNHLLITGEHGVGKSHLVRRIHDLRPGRRRKLVTLPLTSSLDRFEDSLCGHVKGSYSGAVSNRPGCIARAAGGTLYLDEVGELPPAAQVLLLYLLEEGGYTPIGSDNECFADTRIVLSTNQDLSLKVADGTFRPDLFYRITSGLILHIPPLHERPEDIPALVVARAKKARVVLSPEVISAFAGLHYRGNVRELLGAVDRVITIADGHQVDAALVARCAPVPIAPRSLPRAPSDPRAGSTARWIPSPSEQPDDPDALADKFFALHGYRLAPAKRHLILRGLAKAGHNMTKCARLLEVGYPVIRRAASGDNRGGLDS